MARYSTLFTRVLLGLFVAVGLVVSGCDSSSDSESWEGNWELTEYDSDTNDGVFNEIDSDDSDDDDDFQYWSLSSDEFIFVTVDDADPGEEQECFISRSTVVEIDGNKVTTDFGGTLSTVELTVNDGILNGEVVRDDNPEVEDDAFTARGLNGDPRDQAEDCRKSKSAAPFFSN